MHENDFLKYNIGACIAKMKALCNNNMDEIYNPLYIAIYAEAKYYLSELDDAKQRKSYARRMKRLDPNNEDGYEDEDEDLNTDQDDHNDRSE